MIETLNEKQVTALRGMVKECSDSLARQEAEATLRKEIATRAKEELEMPKRQFNQLVKVIHKQNLEAMKADVVELEDLVDIIKHSKS